MDAVVTINAGSSSLKFAAFRPGHPPLRVVSGRVERIGLPGAFLTTTAPGTGASERHEVAAPDHAACLRLVGEILDARVAVRAIGHRVVHGGPKYSAPERITQAVIEELRRLSPYDPEHMPAELALIEAFVTRYPGLLQVACFDTAFHHDLPRVAQLLPLPRRYEAEGVRRYGFHGLSYTFLMKALANRLGVAPARGRVILAHLGNGASLAAVRDGKPIDTTMAFTPTAGLVMSSRSGDLDPGVVGYFAREHDMTPEQFHAMVNAESGLRGVSETSSDVRDLLAREASDVRAAEAVELFCYQARKWIGAFTAALGGLDVLVFAGGIGENAPVIRARICTGLEFLGLKLDPGRNARGDVVMSADGSRVLVCMIRTDEEMEIAEAVCAMMEGS